MVEDGGGIEVVIGGERTKMGLLLYVHSVWAGMEVASRGGSCVSDMVVDGGGTEVVIGGEGTKMGEGGEAFIFDGEGMEVSKSLHGDWRRPPSCRNLKKFPK